MENFKKIDKQFDYIFFARAYLMLAYSGVENRKNNSLAKECVYEIAQEHNYIIAPILYNTKPAIELFIKSISKILKLTDQDFEKKHNINLLFSKIKKELAKNKKIKEKDIDKLEELIIRYHQNNFLNKKFKNNFLMEDEQNDIFRYPDNKAKIELNFEEIFYQFKTNDFEEIKNDIKQFYNLFYDIGAEILGINEEINKVSL